MGTVAIARGADPRAIPTLDAEIRKALDDAPLKLLFKGTTSADLRDWQKEFGGLIRKFLGPHTPPVRWKARRLATETFADHSREEWLLEADKTMSLPLYLLRPTELKFGKGPHPLVLCLHGHGPYGHDAVAGVDETPERAQNIKGANYDYARQLAREGFVTVAPCLLPFGRRLEESYANSKTDACAVTFVRLMLLGQTLMGSNLRDCRWALDWATRQPGVTRDRIGCVGLSYGGRMTMVVSALDERIRCCVISGALNVMQERARGRYSCGAQVIPNLLQHGDTPEIGSLIAPRPCIWEIGSKDGLIVPGWREKAITRLERAYAASGQPDNLLIHRFEGGHRWDGVTALPMLKRVLS